MTPEIDALQRQLKDNPATDRFINPIFAKLDETVELELSNAIKFNIERYAQLTAQQCEYENSSDISRLLKSIDEQFPFFILQISNTLNKSTRVGNLARVFQIIGIIYSVYRTADSKSYVQSFYKSLETEADLKTLNERIRKPEEASAYLPKLIYQELTAIGQHQLTFRSTKNLYELIEIKFCFTGIFQIFLRYYFDLLTGSPNDILATHLDTIFSKLFILTRLKEINHWKNYKNQQALQSKLHHIVQLNSPKKRHPTLQKELFNRLLDHHPIIHDGSTRNITTSINKLLREQMSAFDSLSYVKTKLLLNIIQKLKGDGYVIYLLTQMLKTNKEKLVQLRNELNQSPEKTFQQTAKLVTSYTERFLSIERKKSSARKKSKKKNLHNTISQRTSIAKKNLAALKDRKGMLTHDKVASFLEQWMKRLFQKAKKNGALTYDKIPEYLAQFAQEAKPLMVEISQARQEELVTAFNASTQSILDDFSQEGGLAEAEVEEIRTDIKEKTKELNTSDVEKRVEVIEEIGLALSDAYEKQEKIEDVQEKKEEVVDISHLLKKEQVTIGFDNKSPLMTLGDFFTLPLGDRKEKEEYNWFEYHLRYLQIVVEKNKLDPPVLEVIERNLTKLPKVKFKKYFNIFPTNELEETTLFAVHDMWASQALDRLRL